MLATSHYKQTPKPRNSCFTTTFLSFFTMPPYLSSPILSSCCHPTSLPPCLDYPFLPAFTTPFLPAPTTPPYLSLFFFTTPPSLSSPPLPLHHNLSPVFHKFHYTFLHFLQPSSTYFIHYLHNPTYFIYEILYAFFIYVPSCVYMGCHPSLGHPATSQTSF